MIDGIEYPLRHLRPGRVVEERESRFAVQCRKQRTQSFSREVRQFTEWMLLVENAW
jgi:hypothetical protein